MVDIGEYSRWMDNIVHSRYDTVIKCSSEPAPNSTIREQRWLHIINTMFDDHREGKQADTEVDL